MSRQPVWLTYRGIDRYGVAHASRVQNTPAALAEGLFERGFQRARIFDESGEVVGAVQPNIERGLRGKRTWWGEQ